MKSTTLLAVLLSAIALCLALDSNTPSYAAQNAQNTAQPSVLICSPTPTPSTLKLAHSASVVMPEPSETKPRVPSRPTPAPKSHNGISEGDIITGNATHYDVCVPCCGKTDGVTASGLTIRNGMDDPYIIACNWLPFGSVIEFDGQEYTVADRGGSGLSEVGRIDIFTPEGHSHAFELGRKRGEIKIIYLGG